MHHHNTMGAAAPSPPSPALVAGGVHTSPRRPRATFAVHDPDAPPRLKAEDDDYKDRNARPYPRWLTIALRTGLSGLDMAALAITVRFLNKWRQTAGFKEDQFSLVLATAAVALFIDGLAVAMSLARRYGRWEVWTLSIVADVVIGVMGVIGFVMVSWRDSNGYSYQELGWLWVPDGYVVGMLAFVVG